MRFLIVLMTLLSGACMTTKPCLSKDPLLPSTANKLRQRVQDLVGRASDDVAGLRARVDDAVRRGTRAERLSYARGAASTDFSRREDGDNLINAYRNLGFNTVVLCDEYTNENEQMQQLTEVQIEAALLQARRYKMNVILSIVPSAVSQRNASHLKARFANWMKYDKGDIIGLFLLGDDVFLDTIPVATQVEWRKAIREVSTDIPVLGMVGDVALTVNEATRNTYFSKWAFDHLIVLTYPYNLTNNPTYGNALLTQLRTVDPTLPVLNTNSATAEEDLQRYFVAYWSLIYERFLSKMFDHQRVIPVVEAFKYTGSSSGTFNNASAISIAVRETNEALKEYLEDDDWNAMTYFHWGDGIDSPEGLIVHGEWWDAVKISNSMLQRSACIRNEGGVLARYVLGVK